MNKEGAGIRWPFLTLSQLMAENKPKRLWARAPAVGLTLQGP